MGYFHLPPGQTIAPSVGEEGSYVGGWLSDKDPVLKEDVWWFHLHMKRSKFPWAFLKATVRKVFAIGSSSGYR